MIQIDGALRVKKIPQSKHGPFAVGTLTTNVGVFKVKDQMLDAFDAGDYQVTAVIAEFFLGQYVYSGRSITEIRASLADLKVRSESPLDDSHADQDMELDPLDEPPRPPAQPLWPAPVPARAPEPAPTSRSTVDALKTKLKSLGRKSSAKRSDPDRTPGESQEAPVDTTRAAFSEDLWALIEARQPVKLDATIDRARHRDQSQILRERLQYKFKSLDQTFYPL